jgi:aspartate carbamoyltransferase catalytic subunit
MLISALYFTLMLHVLDSRQFSRSDLEDLFVEASRMEEHPGTPLSGKLLATLFYEPSTRTRLSFEAAMMRLGGNVLTTENAREFSSAIKGETVEDTVRVVGGYADAIVLRHFEAGAAERAAAVSPVPIINAGDGAGQHPTQALLDLYTIHRELGRVDGLTITLAGDLKYGRTARSLSYLLGKFTGVCLRFVSPPELRMETDITEYLSASGISFEETDALSPDTDVLYQTRIQKERLAKGEDAEALAGKYVVTREFADRMPEQAIIMHPLPRVDEIQPETDASPRAAYFRQARYGLLVRMALLKRILA